MTVKFLKCSICGNIVGLIHDGGGELVCCGKPMQELVANTEDAAQEKHVPVITVDGSTVRVAVGSVEHPMIEKALHPMDLSADNSWRSALYLKAR